MGEGWPSGEIWTTIKANVISLLSQTVLLTQEEIELK